MDQLLLPYLQATEESERQQRLDELLLLHAAPVIRHILRFRLGFYVDQFGISPYNPDAEDLYQEIMARIIQTLDDLKSASTGSEIEHFRQYTSRVAANTCINFLRAKSPARRRLKDNLRLLLIRHPDFAFWKAEAEFLCGFAVWMGRSRSLSSEPEILRSDEKLADFRSTRFLGENITQAPLSRIIAELFEWIGGPIEIDTMVNLLAALLNVKDHSVESIDHDGPYPEPEPRVARTEVSTSSTVEEHDLLRRLWQAVKRFPSEQRDAFCFRFQDDSGNDLFSLLIEFGIATLPQIAQGFNRSAQHIRRLRSLMPMDGATAAAELNASRSQVNKWRYLAVKRLKKEILPIADQKK